MFHASPILFESENTGPIPAWRAKRGLFLVSFSPIGVRQAFQPDTLTRLNLRVRPNGEARIIHEPVG